MADRRYEDWARRRFSEGDEPTLSLAVAETELLSALFEQANYAWEYGFRPVTDPESCQCIALRTFAALDQFFRDGGPVGFGYQGKQFLHRLCDGRLVKL